MNRPPKRPSDPRGGEPYYIDSECAVCGNDLVLYDQESGWNDEWVCPECDDGVRMDWPEEQYAHPAEIASRSSEDYVPLDET